VRDNFLINNFITEFSDKFEILRNIQSDKVDISEKTWIIYNAKIYNKNNYEIKEKIRLKSNFDYRRIQSLYSDLSSLDIFKLIELRDNYKRLNYSLTEVNLQILKLFSYPVYLLLMTILSALIMFRIKRLNTTMLKISFGLFLSVIIYYINNFFLVMGSNERITLILAVFAPLLTLVFINSFLYYRINEK
jgi:lipopolysaccharide export system permease protein